jgi:hypothetical protein
MVKVAGQSCWSKLLVKVDGQSCRSKLQVKVAGQSCRSKLLVKVAGQSCRSKLLVKVAGQSCWSSVMEYLFLGKSDLTMFEAFMKNGAAAPEYLIVYQVTKNVFYDEMISI